MKLLKLIASFLFDIARAVDKVASGETALMGLGPQVTFHSTDYNDMAALTKIAYDLGAKTVSPEEQRVMMAFVKKATGDKVIMTLADSTLMQKAQASMEALGYAVQVASPGIYIQGQ